MRKFLIIIDAQIDFVNGALGTPEAEHVVKNICDKIESESWDEVYATQDTHEDNYLSTLEGRKLPIKHCIRGSAGWSLHPAISETLKTIKYQVIQKGTFGTSKLARAIASQQTNRDENDFKIEIVGFCTDICVISNALILREAFPNIQIAVDVACCAGTTLDAHKAAIEIMKSCHIDIIG